MKINTVIFECSGLGPKMVYSGSSGFRLKTRRQSEKDASARSHSRNSTIKIISQLLIDYLRNKNIDR